MRDGNEADPRVSVREGADAQEELLCNCEIPVSSDSLPVSPAELTATETQPKGKHLQGHPQNRRNRITTGLLSAVGNRSLVLFAARTPIVGGSATGYSAAGACHELNAFPHCTFAKGFENSKPEPSPDFPSFLGREGSETPPSPARWSAIFVPSLLSMV